MKAKDIVEGKIYDHPSFDIIIKKDNKIMVIHRESFSEIKPIGTAKYLLDKIECKEVTDIASTIKEKVSLSCMPSHATALYVTIFANAEMLMGKRKPGQQLKDVALEYGIAAIEPTEKERKWNLILKKI